MVSRFNRMAAFGLVVATLAFTPTAAQEERGWNSASGEAIIYRDPNYSGPAANVSRAEANMQLTWPVRSIRVVSGRWQVCSEPNHRGTCVIVDRSQSNFTGRLGPRSELQSLRPVGGSGGGGGHPGPSLRGMAAEFFTAPAEGGQRVRACSRGSASANCAAETADVFCRSRGWNGSAREAMQTVRRQVYLADVLCVRSGY